MKLLKLVLAGALVTALQLPAYAADTPEPDVYAQAANGNPLAITKRYGTNRYRKDLMQLGLLRAIVDHDQERVKAFLAAGALPNRVAGEYGYVAPLELADLLNRGEIADLLISKGADTADRGPGLAGDLARKGAAFIPGGALLTGVLGAQQSRGNSQEFVERVYAEYSDVLSQAEKLFMEAADAKAEAEHTQALLQEEKEHAEALRREDKVWVELQKAVLARNYTKARTLYDQVSEERCDAEVAKTGEELASDVLSKRGKLVYLAVDFDSNAPGGIVAFLDGGKRVYITGLPQGAVVSGERLFLFARVRGTYTYTTVIGGTNTVPHVHVDWKL